MGPAACRLSTNGDLSRLFRAPQAEPRPLRLSARALAGVWGLRGGGGWSSWPRSGEWAGARCEALVASGERRERTGSSRVSHRPLGSRAAAVGSAGPPRGDGGRARGEGKRGRTPPGLPERRGGRGGSAAHSDRPGLRGPRSPSEPPEAPFLFAPTGGGELTALPFTVKMRTGPLGRRTLAARRFRVRAGAGPPLAPRPTSCLASTPLLCSVPPARLSRLLRGAPRLVSRLPLALGLLRCRGAGDSDTQCCAPGGTARLSGRSAQTVPSADVQICFRCFLPEKMLLTDSFVRWRPSVFPCRRRWWPAACEVSRLSPERFDLSAGGSVPCSHFGSGVWASSRRASGLSLCFSVCGSEAGHEARFKRL